MTDIWTYARAETQFPSLETNVYKRFPLYHQHLLDYTGEPDHALLGVPHRRGYIGSKDGVIFKCPENYARMYRRIYQPASFLPFGEDIGIDVKAYSHVRSYYPYMLGMIRNWQWNDIADYHSKLSPEVYLDSSNSKEQRIHVKILKYMLNYYFSNEIPYFHSDYHFYNLLSLPTVQALLDGKIDQRQPKGTLVGDFIHKLCSNRALHDADSVRTNLLILTEFLNPVETLKLGELLHVYYLGSLYNVETLTSLIEMQAIHLRIDQIKLLLSSRFQDSTFNAFFSGGDNGKKFRTLIDPLLQQLREHLVDGANDDVAKLKGDNGFIEMVGGSTIIV